MGLALEQNHNEQDFFTQIDEACASYHKDSLLGRTLPAGTYVSILDRSGANPVQTSHKAESFNALMHEHQGKVDRYFSQCFFNEPDRKGVHCAFISHLWVDLDFYKNPPTSDYRSLHIREKTGMGAWESERLRMFCDQHHIVMPSYIIDSGNGAYALWQFTENQPATEDVKLSFREMMVKLISLFEVWKADPAVKDTSRVLRIPGSINSKTKLPCRIVWPVQGNWLPEQYFEPAVKHGRTYEFHDLYEKLMGKKIHQEDMETSDVLNFCTTLNLPEAIKVAQDADHASDLTRRRKKYQEAKKPRKPRVKRDASVTYLRRTIGHRECADSSKVRNAKGYRSWESWCRKVLHDLKTLIHLRCHGREAKPGFRDMPLFLAGCMIAQIHKPDYIMREVTKWMDGHFDVWMTKNCYTLLSTLKANAQKDFEKGAKKRGYSYTTSDMIQLLALTREEMTHMAVLIDREERLLRKRTKRQTEGRKERPHSTGQTREKWLEQTKAGSQEQAKPWEALNISRKTFYKRKKQGLI
ncbi:MULTISPECIES: hypothetical protein [Acetobacter]|uniref:hypothetical protein n=1 Tax=Acetobacter TaxID=434 RepID=UPI0037703463